MEVCPFTIAFAHRVHGKRKQSHSDGAGGHWGIGACFHLLFPHGHKRVALHYEGGVGRIVEGFTPGRDGRDWWSPWIRKTGQEGSNEVDRDGRSSVLYNFHSDEATEACNDVARVRDDALPPCLLTCCIQFSPSTWKGGPYVHTSCSVESFACRPPRYGAGHVMYMYPGAELQTCLNSGVLCSPPPPTPTSWHSCISLCSDLFFIISISSCPGISRMIVVRTDCGWACSIIPEYYHLFPLKELPCSVTKHEVSGFVRVSHVKLGSETFQTSWAERSTFIMHQGGPSAPKCQLDRKKVGDLIQLQHRYPRRARSSRLCNREVVLVCLLAWYLGTPRCTG